MAIKMFVVLLLFLMELVLGVAYPLYMTLRIIVGSEDISKEFQTWSFYWIAFSVIQSTLGACTWLPLRFVKVALIFFIVNAKGAVIGLDFTTQFVYPSLVSAFDRIKDKTKEKVK